MKDSGKMIKRKAMESKNSPIYAYIREITLKASLKETAILAGVTDRLMRANGGRENDTALASGKESMGRYTKGNGGTASQMGQGLLTTKVTPMKGNSRSH